MPETATLTEPIVITDAAAQDINSHVKAYVRPGRWWAEVQAMNECRHGCKLYVRRCGAVLQYRLIHSGSYGCDLGRHADTREVKVSVRTAKH